MKQRGELGGALMRFDASLPTPRRMTGRLGVRLQRVSDGKLEVITGPDENDVARPGCVAEWNKLHADYSQTKLRIRPGDRITAVNHSPDYMSMLEEIDQAPRMTLSIERDRPGVMQPAQPVSESKVQTVKKIEEGLASRRPLLPPISPIKTGTRRPSFNSISEGSTREPTPRKDDSESSVDVFWSISREHKTSVVDSVHNF